MIQRSAQLGSVSHRELSSQGTLTDCFPAVSLPRSIFSLVHLALTNVALLAPILSAYVPVFAAGAAFVYVNGGIVLGELDSCLGYILYGR